MVKSLTHKLAIKLDSIGFVASTLCAIHCAAMPFLIIFLTFYGFQFIANPVIEYLFIGSSILIGTFTFRHGYINHHRKIFPFSLFFSGLLIVIFGHFLFDSHSETEIQHNNNTIFFMIAPIGAFFIALGHYLNRKLSKNQKSKVCSC